LPRTKPILRLALRLRCLYCGQHSLLKPGSWFEFVKGCPRCSYRYEREDGYYTSASWMINFPLTASLAFLLVVYLIGADLALSSLQVAMLASAFTLGFGLFIFPFAQAFWMYIEHRIHPLTAEDELNNERISTEP
jgi:hypothetical protein